jgi:hypothetical protein
VKVDIGPFQNGHFESLSIGVSRRLGQFRSVIIAPSLLAGHRGLPLGAGFDGGLIAMGR